MSDYKIDMQKLADAQKELNELTWERAKAEAGLIETTRDLNTALRGVPAGWKVALRRWQSGDGLDTRPTPPAPTPPAPKLPPTPPSPPNTGFVGRGGGELRSLPIPGESGKAPTITLPIVGEIPVVISPPRSKDPYLPPPLEIDDPGPKSPWWSLSPGPTIPGPGNTLGSLSAMSTPIETQQPQSDSGDVHIHGDVYGWDDFKSKVSQAMGEKQRGRSMGRFGLAGGV